MVHLSLRTVLLRALGALGFLLVASHASQAVDCFADWSDAAPIVSREGLRTARDVQGEARNQLGAEVVRITLCQSKGAFVYRLVLRSADGHLRNATVSAANTDH